jgi:polyisoprenoid-binding protein YceI
MATTKWVFDPTHSELGFKIRHLMITTISGSFKNFQVEVHGEDIDLRTAEIKAKVEINSIDTGNLQRDEHLRNSDFFEVEKYPELAFESVKVEKLDNDTYELHGILTMKGVTKPVKLNVVYNGMTKDPYGGERAGFEVTGRINRADWGLTFNAVLETGGVALGEEVRINSEIQLVKQAVSAAA